MPDQTTPATDEQLLPLDTSCTRRGCQGRVDYPDNGEVADGERGRCYACDRPHVAVAYTDGTMRSEYDEAEARRERRAQRKAFMAVKKNPNL